MNRIVFVVFFSFILMLLGCSPNNNHEMMKKYSIDDFGCSVSIQPCQQTLSDLYKIALLSAEEKFIAETPVVLLLTADPINDEKKLTAVHSIPSIINMTGWMTGKNMYMGKIPVIFSKETLNKREVWRAETMVGLCAEAQMHWQLALTITLDDGTEKVLMYEVVSYRN
jgi:hypothetical protein